MSNPKTVALIGAGQMTFENHLPVLGELGFSPSWIIDSSPTYRERTRKYFGGTPVDPSFDLTTLAAPDLVLVSCPFGVREPYFKFLTTEWLGSAIFIEKPIALTANSHQGLLSLRPEYKLASGFSKRSQASVQWIKELMTENAFGQLRSASIELGGLGLKTGGKYTANIGLAGGGILFEIGVHFIDLLNFVTGSTKFSATSCNMEFDGPFEIHTAAEYTLLSNTHEFPVSLTASILRTSTNRISLHFDGITVYFSPFGNEISASVRGKPEEFLIGRPPSFENPHVGSGSLYVYWRDFLRSAESRDLNYTSLGSCLLATEILEAVYRMGGRDI